MVKATAVLPLVKEVKVAAEIPRVQEVVKTVARIPQVKVARGYKPKAGPVILAVVNECAEEAQALTIERLGPRNLYFIET